MNSAGLNPARAGPRSGKRARTGNLAQGPQPFEQIEKNHRHYFFVSLTFALKPLSFLSFASPSPRQWTTT
jgi:hypothetical protein